MPVCVVCGSEEYKDGLCKKHYYEYKLKKQKFNFSVKYCVVCGTIYYKNKKYNEKQFFEKIERELKKIDENIKIDNLNIKFYNYDLGSINIDYIVCKDCGRIIANYYNIIIQIRGSERFVNNVKKEINMFINKGLFNLIDEKYNKNGIDLLIYSKRMNLSKIISNFKRYGKIKINSKIVTLDKQTSKLKKRVTILIRE